MSQIVATFAGRIVLRNPTTEDVPGAPVFEEAPTVDALERTIETQLEAEYGCEVSVDLTRTDR